MGNVTKEFISMSRADIRKKVSAAMKKEAKKREDVKVQRMANQRLAGRAGKAKTKEEAKAPAGGVS